MTDREYQKRYEHFFPKLPAIDTTTLNYRMEHLFASYQATHNEYTLLEWLYLAMVSVRLDKFCTR